MKVEIMDGVKTVMEEAADFAGGFEAYSYLWLDDRQSYLSQFLTYGRQLTMEEYDLVTSNDALQPKPCPPKMEQFREQVLIRFFSPEQLHFELSCHFLQIDNYESLFYEIEELESFQIFNGWFQVDLRPFKQALLNNVRIWGNMFKQHLIENVTVRQV